MSIQEQIARLKELILLGEHQRYTSALREIIEKLNRSLQDDPLSKLDRDFVLPTGPDPDPLLTRYSAIFQPIAEKQILRGGDGDGEPLKEILALKKELVVFHNAQATRLEREMAQLGQETKAFAVAP